MDAALFTPFLLQIAAGAAELAVLTWWTKRADAPERLQKANIAGLLLLGAGMMAAAIVADLHWIVDCLIAALIFFALTLAHSRIVFGASMRMRNIDHPPPGRTVLLAKLMGSTFVLMGAQFGLMVYGSLLALRFALDRGWDRLNAALLAGGVSLVLFAVALVVADAAGARLIRHLDKDRPSRRRRLGASHRLVKLCRRWLEYAVAVVAAAALYLTALDLHAKLSVNWGGAIFLVLYAGIALRRKLAPRPRRALAAVAAAVLLFSFWRLGEVVVPVILLTRAAAGEDPEKVYELTLAGADPHRRDGTYFGLDAVAVAIYAVRPASLHALLQAGADPNRGYRGYTPLAMAAREGNAEMVEDLLEAGALVHESGSRVLTPLGIAAHWGHVEVSRLLIAAGASTRGLPKQRMPLWEAAEHDHPEIVRLLIGSGVPVGSRVRRGATALHEAAKHGALEAAAALLNAGAEPKARDRDGLPPSDYAANAKANKDEMLALLERPRPTRPGRPSARP